MTLRLYGGGPNFCIPNYSVIRNLVFDLAALTPSAELSSWEKLFVVHSVGVGTNPRYLADLYLACGCFAEARQLYSNPEHPRKLGDICWCEGDLDGAERFYSRCTSEAQSYRNSPDEDRLIKLAFVQEQWERVMERFATASFAPGVFPGRVILGQSDTAAQPYLDMLAIAVCKSGSPTPPKVVDILAKCFDEKPKQWAKFLATGAHGDSKTVAKLKSRCRPRIGAQKGITFEEALSRGESARSKHVLEYIKHADESLELAQKALDGFADTGDERQLEEFIGFVTNSGVTAMSHTFLFTALGHGSFRNSGISPERLARLYSSHSVMNKRHFGELLDLRFTHRLPIIAGDVLTGIFQRFGQLSFSLKNEDENNVLDLARLGSCEVWAQIRLEYWLRKRASERMEKVASIWREGTAQPVTNPFYGGVAPHPPESPRNMKEWNDLMAEALAWLEGHWKREIGNTPWVAENQLYQLLRRLLKGHEVQQHARPIWLDPQHLDVYLPDAGVAVEYMGKQHFEPVDFFGGEPAFRLLVERDRKKAVLCQHQGIELIMVRFDEDVGIRAREIAERICPGKSRLTGRSALVAAREGGQNP